jgi:adenosine deaminase
VAYEFVTSLKSAADDYDMRIFPHICIGREADADTGIEIAKIALEFDGEVALNLVCDEANNPPEKHLPAYKLTFGSKVRRDCHAGEWVHREPRETYRRRLLDNICTAIFDLRCDGIGHAISLADHEHLVQYVADNGIRVSGCPLSNLRCGLITSVYDLRIDYLLDAGVCYTLNPDDDFFLPAMPEVIAVCDEAYRFTPEQARKLEKNVILGAFAR